MAHQRVALGLFVFNGERHIAAAIDSLLAQTMEDFVLDISDNASTDGTEEICRSYTALDSRVRYVRQDANQGAAWNCNFVAKASPSTEFFKWCAHDDIHDSTYLERCVDLLDADPNLICTHTRTRYIDDHGNELLRSFRQQHFGDSRPWVRFDQILRKHHDFTYAFALTRRSALNRTRFYQPVFSGDGVIMSELAFQGPFGEVPEYLFANRMHATRSSVVAAGGRGQKGWAEWWQSNAPHAFPLCQTLSALQKIIASAPLSGAAKARCYDVLGRWVLERWKGFGWEIASQAPRAVSRQLARGRQ